MGYVNASQRRKLQKAQSFFGGNFTQSKGYSISYSPVIDSDNIIFLTGDVRRVLTSEDMVASVLAIGKNKGVYLKPWQIARVKVKGEHAQAKYLHLVKLNRNHFRGYYFRRRDMLDKDERGFFVGISDWKESTFDDLYEAALLQQKENIQVEICV